MDDKKLKWICCENAIVKTIVIPIALVTAQLLSVVMDRATDGDVSSVVRYSAAMLLCVVISVVFQTISNITLQKQQSKAVNRYKSNFLKIFLNNPVYRLFQSNYGEIIENLTNDLETVTQRYITLYPSMIAGTLGMIGYLAFLMCKSPIVAVSLLGLALLQLFPPIVVKKYMQVNYDQCREIEAKITDHIVEAVNGFEVIKLYGVKQWWQDKMAVYHRAYLRIGRKADTTAAAQRSMYRLLDHILKFGTYALMGIYTMLGCCTMDVAIQAIYLSGIIFEVMKMLFSTIPELAVSKNAKKRLQKWESKKENTQNVAGHSVSENIVIKDLAFSYGNIPVINKIDYQFDSGKNYMLKGSNGTGKSTLIHLLNGLLLPERGDIFRPENQRVPAIFFIPQQDPEYSFNAYTLFEMFGKEKKEQIIGIAKRLGLDEAIIKGSDIRELSGGERKKVFLSIGFAAESIWLVLDEPTNNLDSHGKEVLLEMLEKRKNTILISHDVMFQKAADHCLYIKNGRLYDEGKM